jgi:hypothetical protein
MNEKLMNGTLRWEICKTVMENFAKGNNSPREMVEEAMELEEASTTW